MSKKLSLTTSDGSSYEGKFQDNGDYLTQKNTFGADLHINKSQIVTAENKGSLGKKIAVGVIAASFGIPFL